MHTHRFALIFSLVLLAQACSDSATAPAEETLDAGTPDVAPEEVGEAQDTEPDSQPDAAPEEVGGPVCGDLVCEEGEEATCEADCAAAPLSLHDPRTGELFAFPDDFFTVDEPGTETGLRVNITSDNLISLLAFPEPFRGVFTDLSSLDGFGTSAGGFARFSRPLNPDNIPSGLETAEPGSPVIFGFLDEGVLRRVPVEIKLTDEDHTLVFRPMVPLPATAQAIAAVTVAVSGVDGLPSAPGAWTRAFLQGEGEPRLQPRYESAVEALVASGAIEGPEDLSALIVFTTQSIESESVAIAEDIRGREHGITERLGCEARELFRRCQVVFEAGNYRGENRVVDLSGGVAPQGLYSLTANVYLPLEASDLGVPYPVIIFGHGLNGERDQARRLADFAAPLGIATVAIDAPEHGDHPARSGQGQASGLLSFFGFDDRFFMQALALRDNWRQATYDKLSLIEVLAANADVDGDGEADLDGERLMYLGVSLGGIMGSELLALTEDIEVAVLVVPGGRVTDIMQFGELFAPLVRLLTPNGVGSGDVDRFWPILQTAIERGDAANWAAHVLQDRLVGQPQDVLFGMVLDDDIVPEAANFLLARAMQIPHMPPRHKPIGLIPEGSPLPVSDNLPEGVTAGLLQFDVVIEGEAQVTATHNNIGDSEVGAEAWFQFLDTWLRTGSATIVDPYESLGIRP